MPIVYKNNTCQYLLISAVFQRVKLTNRQPRGVSGSMGWKESGPPKLMPIFPTCRYAKPTNRQFTNLGELAVKCVGKYWDH